MAKLNAHIPGVDDYIWQCDCHDNHYLKLSWDTYNMPEFRYLLVEGVFRSNRLRDRIREAFKVFTGREHQWCELYLSDEVVADLKEFFNVKI